LLYTNDDVGRVPILHAMHVTMGAPDEMWLAAEADFASARAMPHRDSCTWSFVMVLHSEGLMLTNFLNIVLCSCASRHIYYWLEEFAYVLPMSFVLSVETFSEFCIRES
jgi:hypothetical protein